MHKNTLLELRTDKNKKKEEKWQLDGEVEEVKGIKKKMKIESKEGKEENEEEKLCKQSQSGPIDKTLWVLKERKPKREKIPFALFPPSSSSSLVLL